MQGRNPCADAQMPRGENLKPYQWPPGVAGGGSQRNAGLTFLGWVHRMQSAREPKLRAIADDPREPVVKRAAARHVLRWLTDGFARSGKPFAGDDLDRLMDRTLGRPAQAITVTRIHETQDPTALEQEFARLLRAFPGLASIAIERPLVEPDSARVTRIDDEPSSAALPPPAA